MITERVLDATGEWQNRPLDPVYPMIFLDAVPMKVRECAALAAGSRCTPASRATITRTPS